MAACCVCCHGAPGQDPHVFATSGRDGAIRIWDVRTSGTIDGDGNLCHRPAQTILNAHRTPNAVAAAGNRGRQPGGPAVVHSVTAVALANDGRSIVSGGADGRIHVWVRVV